MWNIRTQFIQNEKITSYFLSNSFVKGMVVVPCSYCPLKVEDQHGTRTPLIPVIPHWAERDCAVKNSPPLIPLKLHSAGENNVPEASRKSCEGRPSGVSVSGGWCEHQAKRRCVAPHIHHERRAQDTSLNEHGEWRALQRRVRDGNQKRG